MSDDAPRTLVDLSKARRFDVRQLLKAVAIICVLLFVTSGPGIREAGEQMEPGIERTLVLAVGEPAGALGDVIPLHEVADEATAWLSTDEDLGEGGGFTAQAQDTGTAGGGVPPVGPEAFDPAALGQEVQKRPLKRLLVTGDSLAMPLDAKLARELAGRGVEVERDPHIGTGISKDILVDWAKLSTKQSKDEYDAVVMFIGANEGFPLPGPGGKDVECCGPDWAALYATRARTMMNTYRRDGATKVYWLTVMTPRDPERAEIARAVDAGIFAAAAAYRAQVRVLDMVPIFTPGFRYRTSMEIDGEDTIVRESDGIHLNDAGADLAAEHVLRAIERDFGE